MSGDADQDDQASTSDRTRTGDRAGVRGEAQQRSPHRATARSTAAGPPAPGAGGGSEGSSLAEEQQLRSAAFTQSSALILIVGADGHCLQTNPALTRLLGWSRAELSERPFWDLLVVAEDVEGARDCLQRAVQHGEAFPQEADWLDHRGQRRRISMQTDALRDEHGRPCAMLIVGVEVTEQRRAEEALRRRASTDALTGLLNRAAFYEALTSLLADPAGDGCGLLYCDLDGFKAVNDSHGHRTGDLLLQEVATRLRAVAGPDALIARLGGDEFALLCPDADEPGLAVLADRLQQAIRRPVTTPAGVLSIDVSIGSVRAAAHAHPDEVVHSADQRMYGVKAAHRRARQLR